MKPPVLAVSGATGFVGTHLLASGALDGIVAVSRSARPARPGITWVTGNLADPGVARALVRPGSCVVHLAYSQSADAEENARMLEGLIAAAIAAPAACFIHLSTAQVVGSAPGKVIDETTDPRPADEYARRKLALERTVADRLTGRVPWRILRPTLVLGPGGTNLLAQVNRLTRRSTAANWLAASLLYHRAMNLVPVENVVAAIRHVASHLPACDGRVYFVTDDESPDNIHGRVDAALRRGLGLRPYPVPPVRLPRVVLRAAFAAVGRSGEDPLRTYSSVALRASGFVPVEPLLPAVARFARWCAMAERQELAASTPGRS